MHSHVYALVLTSGEIPTGLRFSRTRRVKRVCTRWFSGDERRRSVVILKTVIQRGVRRTSGISHVVNPDAQRETRNGGAVDRERARE
jgi:hypothetical protein